MGTLTLGFASCQLHDLQFFDVYMQTDGATGIPWMQIYWKNQKHLEAQC